MQDELGKFIRELMPRLGADERIVALEIYKRLAASDTILWPSHLQSTCRI
jgi:hypothetical protein